MNESPAVITTLLDAGADINAQNNEGKSPFDYVKENEALADSAAYWALHDAQFE